MITNSAWPASEPACYGVGCHRHALCARYLAVDGNTNPAQIFMGCCGLDRASFVPVAGPAPAAERGPA